MSDEFIDYHLDQILKAAGSALKYFDKEYTTHLNMRSALKKCIEESKKENK